MTTKNKSGAGKGGNQARRPSTPTPPPAFKKSSSRRQNPASPTHENSEENHSSDPATAASAAMGVLVATKKKIKINNELAQALGAMMGSTVKVAMYTGCSGCRKNLDEYSAEEDIPVEKINKCPGCRAIFVAELKLLCYCCGTKTNSSGDCVSCDAESSDPYELKVAAIYIKRSKGGEPDMIRHEAYSYLSNKNMMARLIAQAKAERWIESAELVPVTQQGGQGGGGQKRYPDTERY